MKHLLLAAIIAAIIGLVACSGHAPRKIMYSVVDPPTQEWFDLQQKLLDAREAGLISDSDWKNVVAIRDQGSATMKQIWTVESNISAGLATAEALTPLLGDFEAIIAQLRKLYYGKFATKPISQTIPVVEQPTVIPNIVEAY